LFADTENQYLQSINETVVRFDNTIAHSTKNVNFIKFAIGEFLIKTIRQQLLSDLFHIKADFYSRSGRPSPKKAPKVTTIGISNRVSDTPRSYERAPKVSATLMKANG